MYHFVSEGNKTIEFVNPLQNHGEFMLYEEE